MFNDFLINFTLENDPKESSQAGKKRRSTRIETIRLNKSEIFKFTNEFWTARQRQAHSIHEISYRACFKPQLPGFFIKHLTKPNDYVYDPFLGRGTTIIEAGLLNRQVVGNDINPLSIILTEGRFIAPEYSQLERYLKSIPFRKNLKAETDLSMFYHPDTESELVSLKNYLLKKEKEDSLSEMDKWIRMVATNRLTGHSKGFFSVYTMPPNQAVSQEAQKKINQKKAQTPIYRDVKSLILKKTKALTRNLTQEQRKTLTNTHKNAIFLNKDARETKEIPDNFVQLTVTSPPFLNIVQYAKDNWLRGWFNGIDIPNVEKRITMTGTLKKWTDVMQAVFDELFRITCRNGFVAFEVGEVRKGSILLEEYVVPLGIKSGFEVQGIIINQQQFTKTSNIWGIKNNDGGTNTNRILLLKKP